MWLPGGADRDTIGGVLERALELRVVVDLLLENKQRGSRALLSRVTKRGLQDLRDREIAIGHRRYDGRVFSASLGKQIHIRLGVEHPQRRVGAAGQDDNVNVIVARKSRANRATVAGHELQHFERHTRAPEALAEQVGSQHRAGCRFEDDSVASRERASDPANGNRDRKIPRRNHGNDTAARCFDTIQAVERDSRSSVVLAEVDAFRDFWIRLQEDLAALCHRGPHEFAARDTEPVRNLAEHRRAFLGRQ